MIFVDSRHFDRSAQQGLHDGYIRFTVNVFFISSELLARFHSEGHEDFRRAHIHSHGLSIFHSCEHGKYCSATTATRGIASSPAGMGMVMDFFCAVLPFPEHSRQGLVMVSRRPWHVRHAARMKNGPVSTVSMPVPLHVRHFCGLLPAAQRVPLHVGQVSTIRTLTFLLQPRTAS